MQSLEAELAEAQELAVADLADAIESIGFECTRCGACCKAIECGDGDEDAAAGQRHRRGTAHGSPADRSAAAKRMMHATPDSA